MGRNLETLQRLFGAYEGGRKNNLEDYLSHCAPDIQYDAFQHPTDAQEAGVFYLTRKDGIDAVRAFHQRLQGPEGMPFERYDIKRWYDCGDTVLLLVDIKATVLGTGKTYEDQHMLEYNFTEDGRICGFRHWLDTAKHIRANTKD